MSFPKYSLVELELWEDIIYWEKREKAFPVEGSIYRDSVRLNNEILIDKNSAPT